MKVSVAIATYNRAAMVREAIQSALAQTRPPDEIVVSDDASTDETSAALTACDPRVRVFRQVFRLGGAANANFAMNQTRGDFIAWCSDDDRFFPDHLEASLAYLDAHPEVGFVHSGFEDALEVGRSCEYVARPLRSAVPIVIGSDCLLPYLIRYYDWPFHPSTLVMRREVWERTGPFDEAYALTDTEWFVRAVETFRAALLPRHGVINRRHAGNWSNRVGSAPMQREMCEIVERSILRLWPEQRAKRMFWCAAWRSAARLHLAVTLRMRLSSGHETAACAAWHGLLQDTGRRTPQWLERMGAGVIHYWCARREPRFEKVHQKVSPL